MRFDSRLDISLPELVGFTVADVLQSFDVHLTPTVQAERPHFGDVRSEVPVDAGALDTDEDAEVDGGPVRVGGVAVRTDRVAGDVVPDVVQVENLPAAQRVEDLALDGLLPVLHLLQGAHLELPHRAVQGDQLEVGDGRLRLGGKSLPLVSLLLLAVLLLVQFWLTEFKSQVLLVTP